VEGQRGTRRIYKGGQRFNVCYDPGSRPHGEPCCLNKIPSLIPLQVPYDKPEQALVMVNRWLSGQDL
jgi:hypothetical protein